MASQLGWHPDEPPSSTVELKLLKKKRKKDIREETRPIPKKTESKQPPRETYNEAYHHGPNKTPSAR